jgi:hypothetical protein
MRFSSILRPLAGLVLAALCPALAHGQARPPSAPPPSALTAELAQGWRAAAQADVEAAHSLLADNHPAALPEVGDPVFREKLDAAYATAKARAAEVGTYEAYAATLAAFANTMSDGHIWSRTTLQVARPDWAGLLVSKRGDRWIVTDEDAGDPAASLLGAELVSCDGQPVEALARERLGGFRADWSVGAQQVKTAPWLLVDERNPFAPRPKACVFGKAGVPRTVTLAWRPAKRDVLAPRILKAQGVGAAGFGLRRVGSGYWISIQSLTDPAAPVVAAVQAQAATLRAAPFVVLDLRGDTGGSSTFGRQVAEALMGPAHVNGVLPETYGGCDSAWRVSPGNLAQLESYRGMSATRGADFTRLLDKALAEAYAARDAGRAFSKPLTCPTPPKPDPAKAPPSLMKGRLILLTDSVCFSSCLTVTEDFRALGALHVGQTTDADTRYSEVREILLPSGLSTFSTLQAVSMNATPRQGPFVPAVAYDGDIGDTPAVETWIQGLARQP